MNTGIPLRALALLSAFAVVRHAQAAGPAAKPNFIVILTDDHGFADLGVLGTRKDVKTPNLDALAADGVRFTRGYVTAPQCVPSRAGLLTGRYQTRFGLESNPDTPLTLRESTLADRLRRAGYVTGMIGKWHLDPNRQSRRKPDGDRAPEDYRPGRRGFDEYFNGTMRAYEASFDLAGDAWPGAPRTIRDDRYRVDVQTDAALAFLGRHAGDRFFLYLAYFAPHVPLERPSPYMSRFADVPDETRRMGLAALSAVDDGVGRIRAFLRERGLEGNTLIFFLGDNGAPLKERAWNGSLNEPLVGEKGMLTDGGIRVPFLAAWKGVLPAGKSYDRPVISLDVAATAGAASGLPLDPALDGVDLLPHVTGERPAAPHEFLYWRFRSQAAVLSGRWKLVLLGPDHRFLFDLDGAAGETASVAERHPEVVGRLEGALRAWAAEQNPPGLPKDYHKEDLYFFDRHLKLGAGHARPSAGPRPREK